MEYRQKAYSQREYRQRGDDKRADRKSVRRGNREEKKRLSIFVCERLV